MAGVVVLLDVIEIHGAHDPRPLIEFAREPHGIHARTLSVAWDRGHREFRSHQAALLHQPCAAQSGRNHSARTGAGFQRASQARDRIFVARCRQIGGNMQSESKRAGGKPSKWYFDLTTQVLVAMLLGALAGWLFPQIGAALKPFAELFIRMVKMVIGPLVFLMVVAGISGMGDLKKVGRVGVKAVVYFEVVTTVALVVGLVAGNLFHPGSHMSPPEPTESQRAVIEKFSGIAKEHSVLDFLLNIVPDNVVGAFVHADVLQIMFFAVLFGAAVLAMGEKGRKIEETIDRLAAALFVAIAIVLRYAPIAAFSAMAFTVAAFVLSSLGSLALFVLSTYVAIAYFVFA